MAVVTAAAVQGCKRGGVRSGDGNQATSQPTVGTAEQRPRPGSPPKRSHGLLRICCGTHRSFPVPPLKALPECVKPLTLLRAAARASPMHARCKHAWQDRSFLGTLHSAHSVLNSANTDTGSQAIQHSS